MIYSKILSDKAAREKLTAGVNAISNATASTLGPQGMNCAIGLVTPSNEIWQRMVVHDGVTVAKSIWLEDEFEDMGAQLIKQAALKQVMEVGDGTTVAIILAQAFYEGIQTLIAAGVNPMSLRRSIEANIESLVREIEKEAIPVKSLEELKEVATISAEDKELGEKIASVIYEMGVEGLVTIEESKKTETIIEKQVGMQLEYGWLNPFFQTNPDRLEAYWENPRLLVTDKTMVTLAGMEPLLGRFVKTKEPLIIIAPSFSSDVVGAMIQNKMNGALNALLIKAPSFGQNQKNSLQDIAIYTGAKFITEDAGDKLEEVKYEDLGRASSVLSTKTESIIIGGKGKKEQIQIRIGEIKKALENEEVEFDRVKMKERLAKLTSGVAVIRVGGFTEVEMRERIERAKDAKEACVAALKHGIVPGGEIIYLHIRKSLKLTDHDFAPSLLYKALYIPFMKLLINAGLNDGEYYEKLKTSPKNSGINVSKGDVVDMIKEGIIDPASVSISALRNAASVAIQLSSTNYIVIQYAKEINQPKR